MFPAQAQTRVFRTQKIVFLAQIRVFPNRKKSVASPIKSGPSPHTNINTPPITRSMISPNKVGSLINTKTTKEVAPSFTRYAGRPPAYPHYRL